MIIIKINLQEYMKMANNCLKDKLDSHGVSQADLSKETGVSTGTINRVCSKTRTPAPRTMSRIVQGLNKLSKSEYGVSDIFV